MHILLRAKHWAGLACAVALSLLAGCAMPRLIDSDVQSFTASAAAVTPASYRFERLPSQVGLPAHDALEAMARNALTQVGLTAVAAGSEASARYAVQLQLDISYVASPYRTSGDYDGLLGRRSGVQGAWFGMHWEPPWTRHGVRVILRETVSGQVAFESSARFEGPWGDSANLLPAILEAAMQGYPNPPVGPRKVVIELPTPGAHD